MCGRRLESSTRCDNIHANDPTVIDCTVPRQLLRAGSVVGAAENAPAPSRWSGAVGVVFRVVRCSHSLKLIESILYYVLKGRRAPQERRATHTLKIGRYRYGFGLCPDSSIRVPARTSVTSKVEGHAVMYELRLYLRAAYYALKGRRAPQERRATYTSVLSYRLLAWKRCQGARGARSGRRLGDTPLLAREEAWSLAHSSEWHPTVDDEY